MNTPTPRTDRAVADSDGQWSFELRYCSRQLETELTAVTEQLTAAREELNTAREDQAYMHNDLTIAIEQRDRLAEALKRIANNNVRDEPHTCYAYELGRMEGIAKIALAAVEGGSDE